MPIWHKISFWKEASLNHATFKENLAKNLISYKNESNTPRSSFPEDQMVLAEYLLSKFPMRNSASIVYMAAKRAKECQQHLNVPYAKQIVGTVT